MELKSSASSVCKPQASRPKAGSESKMEGQSQVEVWKAGAAQV